MDRGEAETYHEQFKSVGFVRDLAESRQIVVAAISDTPGEESISKNLLATGLDRDQFFTRRLGLELVERYRPDAIIARLPHAGVLTGAARSSIPCFPCLADVFVRPDPRRLISRSGVQQWRDYIRFRNLMNRPNVTAVGNHSLGASRSVAEVLGVPTSRIVPWEWSKIPVAETPKRHPGGSRPLELLYVGTLSEEKGVGDLLDAVLDLGRQRPGLASLTLAGKGPLFDSARTSAAQAQGARITVLGAVPKQKVRDLMTMADAIVVPSRPSYAEGMPNALVEGMAYRAPLIVVEHPSTRGRLEHGKNCLLARAADPADLGRQVARLADDRELFDRLTENAAAEYHKLFVGASWYTLIQAFVDDPTDTTGWVHRFSLERIEAQDTLTPPAGTDPAAAIPPAAHRPAGT